MKTSRDLWVLLTLILLFVIGSVFIVQTTAGQNQERLFPRRTTYSAGPGGTKAAFLLLNRLGFRTMRWTKRLDKPPINAKVILIVDALPMLMFSNRENLALDEWAAAGGALISYNGYPRPMPGQEDLDATYVPTAPSRVEPSNRNGYFKGVKSLTVASNVRRSKEKVSVANYDVALKDDKGVIVASRKRGKGAMIAVSDPDLVSNVGIGKADNAVFFVNLVASRARKGDLVVFDEYHQGYGSDRTLARIIGKCGRAAVIQLLLVLLIGLYSYGRRFGEVRPAERPVRRVGFEYVEAMARFYQRAAARTAALETLCGALRRDMAAALGLPDETRLDVIIRAASNAWAIDQNALTDLLLRCDRVIHSVSGMSDGELIRLAAEIQKFRKEAGIDR